ncbi:MAG: 23S rRNA (adenine(1618)-N(6))-methyltransferase RlmF [Gilvibacter sp.]
MHPNNPYSARYDLERLAKQHPALQKHFVLNPAGAQTIDFSDSDAVYNLNKAMLLSDFGLTQYELPKGYLIPPIPGRLEYLLLLQEFMAQQFDVATESVLKGLDIGSGANGIYCILGAQHFNWNMTGAECDPKAVAIANTNLDHTKGLQNKIDFRHQENKSNLFKGIIQPGEFFDFTVCNPPFYSSKEEATKASYKKRRNLTQTSHPKDELNFQGQAGELWCNGGEALFIKRLIKESLLFKSQVKVFSSLVARSENLSKIKKQLTKANANFEILNMDLGNKKSRIVCWWFE